MKAFFLFQRSRSKYPNFCLTKIHNNWDYLNTLHCNNLYDTDFCNCGILRHLYCNIFCKYLLGSHYKSMSHRSISPINKCFQGIFFLQLKFWHVTKAFFKYCVKAIVYVISFHIFFRKINFMHSSLQWSCIFTSDFFIII